MFQITEKTAHVLISNQLLHVLDFSKPPSGWIRIKKGFNLQYFMQNIRVGELKNFGISILNTFDKQ